MNTENIKRKNSKYLILALGFITTGCSIHEPPRYGLLETRKHIAMALEMPGIERVTKKDVLKLGYKMPTAENVEDFSRLDAKCNMTCGNHIVAGAHVVYDSTQACKFACLRSEGWELFEVKDDEK